MVSLVIAGCGGKGDQVRSTGQPISDFGQVRIVTRDDAPHEPGGAALFQETLSITTKDGVTIRNRDDTGSAPPFSYHPVIVGGTLKEGYRQAEGDERIALSYDFTALADHGASGGAIDHVVELSIELLVCNDFLVEVYLDGQGAPPVSTNAAGHPEDGANQGFVHVWLNATPGGNTVAIRQEPPGARPW